MFTHENTSHAKAGYGINGGEKVKYLRQDLAALLEAYGVELTFHPFDDIPHNIYLVEKDKSFAESGELFMRRNELWQRKNQK